MARGPAPPLVLVSPLSPAQNKALLCKSKGYGTKCHVQSKNPGSLFPLLLFPAP